MRSTGSRTHKKRTEIAYLREIESRENRPERGEQRVESRESTAESRERISRAESREQRVERGFREMRVGVRVSKGVLERISRDESGS